MPNFFIVIPQQMIAPRLSVKETFLWLWMLDNYIFFFSLIIFPQFLISQRRIQRTNTEHPQSEIELFLCEKTAQNLHLIKLQKNNNRMFNGLNE